MSGEDTAPLFLVLSLGCLLVLMGFFIQGDSEAGRAYTTGTTTAAPTVVSEPTSTTEANAEAVVHPIPYPARIVIPAIGVDASVINVGLLDNGGMETPPHGLAAWYALGPAPGEPGPAVMLAHVDSSRGPDVFYNLKDLRRYDRIYVYGLDGDYAAFEVDWVEQQLKRELPTDRIWYYSNQALIRLLTCGGRYSSTINHYLSNVIVYGHLLY